MRDTSRFIIAIVLLTAVALGGLAACNTEPTCDKAADRLLALIEKQNEQLMAKVPEAQRKQLAEKANQTLAKERMVERCTKEFSKEQIACMVAARSLEDASRCNQAAAPTGDQPAPGTPPSPPARGDAPAGQGGGDTDEAEADQAGEDDEAE